MVIVAGFVGGKTVGSNTMRSPARASNNACRREPGPESVRVVTRIVVTGVAALIDLRGRNATRKTNNKQPMKGMTVCD